MPDARARFILTAEDRASRKLREVEGRVQSLGKTVTTLNRLLPALGAGAAVAGLSNLIDRTVSSADEIQKLSDRIGASTEALSQYRYVAELTGVEFRALTTGWQRQTRRISEAAAGYVRASEALNGVAKTAGPAGKAIEELGLNAEELARLAPEEQFEILAEAITKVEQSSDRVRIAQALWDSEGVKLLQTIKGGAKQLRAYRQEADSFGLTLTREMVDKAANARDALARFRAVVDGIATSALPFITDQLEKTANDFRNFAQEVREISQAIGELFQKARGIGTFETRGLKETSEDLDAVNQRIKELKLERERLRDALRFREKLPFNIGVDDAKKELGAIEALLVSLDEQRQALEKKQKAALPIQTGRPLETPPPPDDGGRRGASEQEKRAKDIESIISRLREEGATLGLTAEQIEVYRLRALGASPAQIKLANSIASKIRAYEDEREALLDLAEAEQELQMRRERALDIIKSIDPFSDTRDQIQEIQALADEFPQLADSLAEVEFELQAKFDEIGEGGKEAAEKIDSAWQELGGTFSSAFEDALVEGRKFNDVLKGLEQDLIRIATRELFTKPFTESFSSAFKPGGGGLFSGVGDFFGGLFANAQGGLYKVAGFGGGERPVALTAQPGETVSVMPRGRASSGVNVAVTINATDVNSFRRSEQQVANQLALAMRAAGRNL